MKILDYLTNFINDGQYFRNVLIYNNQNISINEVENIGKNIPFYITFSFENNFLVRSYFARLRFYKNLNFLSNSYILNILSPFSFDLIIMDDFNKELFKLIENSEFIQYFIILDYSLIDSSLINSSIFDYVGNGIYKRNKSKVIINNLDNDKKLTNDEKNEKNEKDEKDEKNEKTNLNSNFSIINVLNLIPYEINYLNNNIINNKINDGIIAISIIISNDEDFEKFKNFKDILTKQYDNILYYIAFNGSNTFQYLEYLDNDIEFLIKSKDVQNLEIYFKIFNSIIKNEYQFNINKLNEETIENIWGLT